jgi:hypothetical protein
VGRRTSTRVFCAAFLAVLVAAFLGGSAAAVTFSITPGGSPVTVTISSSGATGTATFSGTGGQRVSLSLTGSTIPQYKVTLVKVNGPTVFTVSATKTAKFVDTNTLPSSGTYKLTVDPSSTYTGKVTLQLYNVPADASAAATFGGASGTVATTVPGQNAYVTFDGIAGHRVALKLSGVTVTAGSVTVLHQDGSVLAPQRAFAKTGSFIDPIDLVQTETYKVVLDPKSKYTGSVTVTAYDVPPDTSAALTLGTPAVGTVSGPGQRAKFTFSGTKDQRISLNVESSDVIGSISLLKPVDLSTVASTNVSPAGGFLDTVVLPVDGTYTVVIDPTGDQTGAVTFVAYNVPADQTQAITAGGPLVTATTTVPGQNAKLTFTATAGQKISVLVSNVSGIDPGELDLLKPGGPSVLAAPITVTSAGAWLQPISLPVAGQYTILIDPQQANVGTADVNLYTVPADKSGTITPGTPLPVTTDAPGQNAKYTFTGTTGQRLSLNLTGVTITSVKVSILKPDGTTLSTKTVGTSGGFIEPVALPVGGTYKVVVDPQSSYFGGITLGLYVVPADQPGAMTAGVGKTFITSVPGQNAKWTFSATLNQRLSFNFTGVTMSSVRVTVKTAAGSPFMSKTFGTDGDFIEPITVTTSGTTTYTVTVDPQGASTGNVTVTYYVVPANATAAAPNPLTVTTPGQNGVITFSLTGAAANHTFTVSTTVPPDPCCADSIELKVFQGATQIGISEFAGPSGYSFIRTLGAGSYTIVVDPFGPATGSVTVTVS